VTTPPPIRLFPSRIYLAGLGLILREWRDDDLPVMAELFDDPDVDRWTPLRAPFDLDAAQAYLAGARELRAADRRIQLAITTDAHAPLGEILLSRAEQHWAVELAYAVGPHHRRQQLASRAVQVITDYAFDTLAMREVLLRIPTDNAASSAVARRAGFRLNDRGPITREGVRYKLLTWRYER
jgi:RimJ/RimL family protein N-acetyltransferase